MKIHIMLSFIAFPGFVAAVPVSQKDTFAMCKAIRIYGESNLVPQSYPAWLEAIADHPIPAYSI